MNYLNKYTNFRYNYWDNLELPYVIYKIIFYCLLNHISVFVIIYQICRNSYTINRLL